LLQLPQNPGLPHGTSLWIQGWRPKADEPYGFAASNAIRGVVP
jgi:hypothetical protein